MGVHPQSQINPLKKTHRNSIKNSNSNKNHGSVTNHSTGSYKKAYTKAPYENRVRKLPCKTYVECGDCPFAGRCRYLHDPRLQTSIGNVTLREKDGKLLNKSDLIGEDPNFYWNPMKEIALKRSTKNGEYQLPAVLQHYNPPPPGKCMYMIQMMMIIIFIMITIFNK